MKHSFLFICLFFFLYENVDAQVIAQPSPSRANTGILLSKSNKKKTGYIMATAGVASGVTGLVLYVGGIVQAANREQQYNNALNSAQANGTPPPPLPDYSDLVPRLLAGRLLMVAGAGLTVVGVVFIVKGIEKERQGLTLNLHPTGFHVAYNF